MGDGGETKLRWLKREITAWREGFMNDTKKTVFLAFVLVLLLGLASVAPRAFDDAYSWIFHQKPQNPFSSTQTIYSNLIPLEHDVIELDKSGTLIPSPYNLPFVSNSQGVCAPGGKPLIGYSKGIVLILNAAPILSAREGRQMSFPLPPPSNYFVFEVGKGLTIKTNERVFFVTLSRINDLSTKENGEYYSYVFDIVEK